MKYGDIGQNRTCRTCGKTIDGAMVVVGDYRHHTSCWFVTEPTGHSKSEPSLSLLIIDLGDSCVVKVEKGDDLHLPGIAISSAGTSDRASLCDNSFPEVKAAIDAMDSEKPVPRIEVVGPTLYLPTVYSLHFKNGREITLSSEQFEELCQLAGVTIPVYEGGKWTDLTEKPNQCFEQLPLSVWRYTR
jgi:hypothetical protein